MKINKIFLTTIMLFAIACSPIAFATEAVVPNTSGEGITSGEISGEVSGDVSGEITPPISGEVSGDIVPPTSGEIEDNILKSVALNSSFVISQNKTLEGKFEATISSGETITYAITILPTHGTVVQSGDNGSTFSYTPDKDYHGKDNFSFRLESGDKYSNVATISISIEQDTSNVIPFHYVDMQNHWANYSASHLAARGLILGEEIGHRFYYCPNKTMTRGDFMLFLLAITESNLDAKVDVSASLFADKDTIPDWLLEAAKVAYSKGIIKGSSENDKIYLNLNNPITRVEAATMISNVLDDKSSTANITYKDVAKIPSWGLKAVKNLSAYKIIQGDSAGTFRPMDILTRGEGAELSFKLLKQLELIDLTGSGDVK